MFRRFTTAAPHVVLFGVLASAQAFGQVAPTTRDTTTAEALVKRSGAVLILGAAFVASERPAAYPTLRLRNLTTSKIERTTVGNLSGEFSFVASPQVPYIVEMLDSSGSVVTTSDVIVAQAGDVSRTVLTVQRLRGGIGLFKGTAGSVLLAATGIGLTVLPLVSPER